MNIKKLARFMRKYKMLVKWVDNRYWVSDGYMMVGLDSDDWEKFRGRLMQYKGYPVIPYLPAESQAETLVISERERQFHHIETFDSIIAKAEESNTYAYETPYINTEHNCRILRKFNNRYIAVNNDYLEIVKDMGYDEITRNSKDDSLLFFRSAGELVAVIAPIINLEDIPEFKNIYEGVENNE